MDFIDRLQGLIADSRKRLSEAAEDLGISQQTLYSYCAGDTTAQYKYLIRLADYYQCSIDYLTGREDFKELTFGKCPLFSERLKKLLADKQVSKYKLCKETKISRSVFYAWLNRKSEPTLYSLIKLADYFDCRMDYLVGRET